MATQQELFNQILTYGIQNNKSEDDILKAILNTGKFDPMTAITQMDAITSSPTASKIFGFGDKKIGQPTGGYEDYIGSGGKTLAAGQLSSSISQPSTGLDLLNNIETKLTEAGGKYTGPIESRVRGVLSKTGLKEQPELSGIKSDLLATAQTLGTYLEGGKLAEGDIKRYLEMLPSVTDNPADAQAKIEAIRANVKTRMENDMKALGSQGYDVSGIAQTLSEKFGAQQAGAQQAGIGTQTMGQQSPELQEAMAFAEQNPDDPRSQQLMQLIQSGQLGGVPQDERAQAAPGVAQAPASAMEQFAPKEEKKPWYEKVGDFLGGSKIGAAIGEVVGGQAAKMGEAGEIFKTTIAGIEQQYEEGNLTKEQRDKMLDAQENAMKDAFGYDGPSLKEVAGDVGKSALTVLGGAEVKGATWLATAGRAALLGTAYGAASAAAEDKGAKDMAKDAVITGLIGGAIPVVGKGAGAAIKKIKGATTADEALAQILQGKTKDMDAGRRALAAIDTKGVKTYKDLNTKLNDSVAYLSGKVDDVLAKDTTLTKLDDMVTAGTTKGGKTVKTNYVDKALNNLKEMYTKIGDDVASAEITELIDKAASEGLTKKEVNDVARIYGSTFGKKAFGKTGEALTSVNAQAYETTRKGIKNFVREGLDGEVIKNMDELISNQLNTQNLIEKNVEAVARAKAKIGKTGVGKKLVAKLDNVLNVATLGGTKALRQSLIKTNLGDETLKMTGIEDVLKKNLQALNKVEKTGNIGELEKYLRGVNKKLLSKAKSKMPGSTITKSTDEAIKQTEKNIITLKKRGLSENSSQIKKLTDELKKLRKNALKE